MENDKKQVNIRMTDETKKKFDIVAAEFGNQQAAMEAIVNAYDMDKAKKALPGNADVINDVQTHLRAIERSFIANYDYIANSDNRIRTEFLKKIEQLEAEKDSLVKQVSNLTQSLQSEKQRADTAEQDLAKSKVVMQTVADLHETFENMKNENKELREKAKQIDELQNQLSEVMTENACLKYELKKSEAEAAMLFMTLGGKKDTSEKVKESQEEFLSNTNTEIREQMAIKMEELSNDETQNT
ncbi:MAG: hypothetical protein IJ906_10710 [Oscillospiraceae bacterium]|nr:hypothetical protein [Oscillospiraceae bacterium]